MGNDLFQDQDMYKCINLQGQVCQFFPQQIILGSSQHEQNAVFEAIFEVRLTLGGVLDYNYRKQF